MESILPGHPRRRPSPKISHGRTCVILLERAFAAKTFRDVAADPGEKTDVADKHPDVVKELDAAYDKWWASVQAQLVNENAIGPKENPFKEL